MLKILVISVMMCILQSCGYIPVKLLLPASSIPIWVSQLDDDKLYLVFMKSNGEDTPLLSLAKKNGYTGKYEHVELVYDNMFYGCRYLWDCDDLDFVETSYYFSGKNVDIVELDNSLYDKNSIYLGLLLFREYIDGKVFREVPPAWTQYMSSTDPVLAMAKAANIEVRVHTVCLERLQLFHTCIRSMVLPDGLYSASMSIGSFVGSFSFPKNKKMI